MKKLIALLLIMLLIVLLAACGMRDAKLTDIEVSYTDKQFYITAKADIEGLTVEYILYDDKGVVLSTLEKEVGDVMKGRTYKVSAVPLFSLYNPASAEIIKVTGKIKT